MTVKKRLLLGWVAGVVLLAAPACRRGTPDAASVIDVQGTLGRLANRADRDGLKALSIEERRALLAYEARAQLGDGFRVYYHDEWRIDDAADGFAALGFRDAAAACMRSKAVFGGGAVPQDPQTRRAVLRRADKMAFAKEDDVVFSISWDTMAVALEKYVRDHRSQFKDVEFVP